MIRVLIAEDHTLLAQGVEWMLVTSGDIEVSGVAESAERAVALATTQQVDVVLMDVNFGTGMSGIEATRLIKAKAPRTKVIVLTMYKDASTISEAIKAGADGYMSKVSSREDLCRAVQEVVAGRSFLHPDLTKRVFTRIAGRDAGVLTETETSILQHLANGKTTKNLARDMSVSQETIKAHLRHVFRKLGVLDRTRAVAEGLRRGLIQ